MRRLFVTKAMLPFGDSAKRFGEWQHRFGRAKIGSAQSLLVCPRQSETARKYLRQGEIVLTVRLLGIPHQVTQPHF